MSLDEFLALKEDLRYCPVCAFKLVEHATNRAIRVCVNHGMVFSIMGTSNGYRVEVDLAGDLEDVQT